ncbi:hypothetical protein K449DRAFT_49122 [Hypoxylon sp. EC38]|nr:hypothetical protein K449DRAFT_49122 [Hypoxylon sp. EC38]
MIYLEHHYREMRRFEPCSWQLQFFFLFFFFPFLDFSPCVVVILSLHSFLTVHPYIAITFCIVYCASNGLGTYCRLNFLCLRLRSSPMVDTVLTKLTAPIIDDHRDCPSTIDSCFVHQLNHVEGIDWHGLSKWTRQNNAVPRSSHAPRFDLRKPRRNCFGTLLPSGSWGK